MTAKLSDTQTGTFEQQVCRELGEISGRLDSIDNRLTKGDENFKTLDAKIDRLACMQPVSACSDTVKPGGWKAPTAYAAGGGAAVTILITISEILKAYIMKGN